LPQPITTCTTSLAAVTNSLSMVVVVMIVRDNWDSYAPEAGVQHER
jgi:hypothetical protein